MAALTLIAQATTAHNKSIMRRIDKEIQHDDDDDDNMDETEMNAHLDGEQSARRPANAMSIQNQATIFRKSRKDHKFEIDDKGKAVVKVHDNVELRTAFLYYGGSLSTIRPQDMHRAHHLPQISTEMYVKMCRDLELIEPTGPLSMMTLGITYSSLKGDDDEGLTYVTHTTLITLMLDA